MYFKDLTRYDHSSIDDKDLPDIFSYADVKNIGWIDKEHGFNKGNVTSEFIKKLKKYCIHTREYISPSNIIQTRGHHHCEFCDSGRSSCEILFISKNKKYYISPAMILHYVIEHNYLPPQEFIDAVMYGPDPESPEYKTEKDTLFKEIGEKWGKKYKEVREKEKLNENLITKFKNFNS